MEKQTKTRRRLNYRITVIFKDEVITEKYSRQDVAMNTVIELRILHPQIFIGGAVEERRIKWEVIWTLNAIDKK